MDINKFYKKFVDRYTLQPEQINHSKFWKSYRFYPSHSAVWHANGCWRVGYTKHKGTDICVLKVSSSNDDLPNNPDLKWLYWNPETKTWIEAGGDFKLSFKLSKQVNL